MSQLDDKIEAFKNLMIEVLPDRVVTRDYKPASEHREEDLRLGVFTLLFHGVPKFGELGASPAGVKLFLLGQFQIEEKYTGSEIEAGELQMLEEITQVLRAAEAKYPDIPRMKAIDCASSTQMEHPYGWVAVVLEMYWTMKCN